MREPEIAAAATAGGAREIEPAPAPALDLRRIDALIADAIAAHKLPGCVIAIGQRDRVLALKAYGERALVPAEDAMTEDTVFDLASLSKSVATATLIAQLVEQGKLKLDDRASKYLPQLNRPSTQAITVRDLLLHGAGLPPVDPLNNYSGDPASALERALRVEPVAPRRGQFMYSDVGYIWLGALVQRISGEALDQLAQHALFEPLAMRDTRYLPPASWLPRIAPTEITKLRGPQPVLIHGTVHDPRAFRLGGVAGNAGVFSTAADLSRYARMLLAGGELDGARVLSEASVAALTRAEAIGGALRTPGFDARSEYSKLRGHKLSRRAFGHGGYTGTSLWVDPERDLFVVFLSNRVHPDATGNVIELIGAITDAAVDAVEQVDRCAFLPSEVKPGIDVLQARGFDVLRGKRIGLVTHLAATTRAGVPTLDVLAHARGVTLAAVLTPEHGLQSNREGRVADQQDAALGVPIYSLFGPTRRPDARMLQGLDALVVDLVDVGTRFYTYMSTLHEVLRAGAESHLPVIVLDRPDPLGGVLVDGPVLDSDVHSFVNHFPLPVVHGMSAGELASLIVREEQLPVQLQVIAASGWRREDRFADAGLRWRQPSPNLPRSESALLYPAIGLLESTNLSVGRGTAQPFEWIGAPWLDPRALIAELARAPLPGVRLRAAAFTPNADPYRGQPCKAVLLEVTDRNAFRPVATALALAHALQKVHASDWHLTDMQKLLGHRRTLDALQAGTQPAAIERLWEPELSAFLQRRARVLLYPDCSR